ncbi:RTA1-domain-containing protein [Aspergillus steynii IBT 23096]|uniref:RTA1-domain-containing protein n=1 Tax=Aspergillus steynii IBT 23096 TaxID=1392250 RepID=A0A2I2GHW9_9EURO|nr:RTA1-domain-containing protein [Aspergillus steynii IBT 23096]PLB52470.1 RTA1-domain-containing protein [Aspergillus steynii IBT 23096]
MSTLPGGLIAFGPDANCTLSLCPLEASILRYKPSIPASCVCIAIFGLSLAVHTLQGWKARSWGFMASVIAGCILEIIGYVGRLIIYNNPFDFNGFLMQIICITVAPVFFCSAIYVLLSQSINHIDASLSRFKAKYFYWIFIPCDIVSLILQAVGGALSCIGTTEDDINVGVNISLGGLVFQVVTLVAFLGLFADYLSTCWRSPARKAFNGHMKIFLGFMFLSVFLILVRCVYRIVELHAGYFSETFRDEPLFIALESAIMCAAAVCLHPGHPGLVFRRGQNYNRGLDGNSFVSGEELKPRADAP